MSTKSIYFLTFVDPQKRPELLQRLANKGATENVLPIYLELDQLGLESDLLLPALDKFFTNINSIETELERLAYLTEVLGWSTIDIVKVKAVSQPYVYIDSGVESKRKHKSIDMSVGRIINFLINSYSKMYPKHAPKTAYCLSDNKLVSTIRKYKDTHFSDHPYQNHDHHKYFKSHKIDFKTEETIQVLEELGLMDYLSKTLKSTGLYYQLIKDRQSKCTQSIEEFLLS